MQQFFVVFPKKTWATFQLVLWYISKKIWRLNWTYVTKDQCCTFPFTKVVDILTLHLIALVSSRLIRTSKPPTSLIASWQVSWARLKSLMAHRAITVAVWLPPYKQQQYLSNLIIFLNQCIKCFKSLKHPVTLTSNISKWIPKLKSEYKLEKV